MEETYVAGIDTGGDATLLLDFLRHPGGMEVVVGPEVCLRWLDFSQFFEVGFALA